MNSDLDVIVLGGGSAGTSAASAACDAGARTLLINDGELGGLCILRGCMPTKAMLYSAERYEEMNHLEPLGLAASGRSFDFSRIMARKDQMVARFKRAKLAGIERAAYTVLDARARFVDAETVEAGGKQYRARGYVIATGSVSSFPPIPGIEQVRVMGSDDVMRMTELPRSIVVQGAGAIGLEFAWFFVRLGVQVLLINRSPLLSRVDPEFTPMLSAAFTEHAGAELLAPATITRLESVAQGIRFTLDVDGQPRTHEAQAYLCAVGRQAALEGLGLDLAGVETEGGVVRHDRNMRSSNEKVYVAGDSTGTYQILHLANQEGRVAGWNAMRGPERVQDYRLKMSVIFTDPPFASVGMTEAEARAAGIEPLVARKHWPEQGRAIVMETRHGMAKLLADPTSGKILGCQILGPGADNLIHIPATMMHYGGTAEDVGQLPWYHPTLAEVFIELGRDLGRQFVVAAV